MIDIVVNGVSRQVPPGVTLDKLLVFLEIDPTRVAVERNRAIARKADWGSITVESGDQLEIVWFVGGG